ncbi:MAG: potassium channel family protein, partial [Planctomycetota bacterium]|nr:potassium channel family protein [Planctomycetota bacterium]
AGLLAALFASIYSVLVLFDNDCFFIQPQLEVPPNELHRQGTHFGVLTYYSIITLTTVGYGDIVPASPVARAIVSMEAVVGQIYLTVIVARLVGLHLSRTLIRQHEADHPHGTNP